MKGIKKIICLLNFTLIVTCIYAKANIPPCPIPDVQVYENNSKLKTIKIQYKDNKSVAELFNKEVKNQIYFAILGFEQGKQEWETIEVFPLEKDYQIDISTKKLQAISLVPNKNVLELNCKFQKDKSTLIISIEKAKINGETKKYVIAENKSHTMSAESYISYENGNYTEYNDLAFFFDEKEIQKISYNAFKEENLKLYENSDDIIFSYEEAYDKKYLFFNDKLIIKAKDSKYVGKTAKDLYYFANGYIYKNDEKLYKADSSFPIYLIDNNIFYADSKSKYDSAIYKNGKILITKLPLNDFVINKNEEIAYVLINEDETTTLYKNSKAYAQTEGSETFSHLAYSPDGRKFYYVLGKPTTWYYAYFLIGDFPISPKTILKNIGEFKFSSDSKYIATNVMDENEKQWYVLSNKMIGPFYKTNGKFYFSDDSKYFYYEYQEKGSDEWKKGSEKLQ